jgi:DNA-binding transcriptional ArsR family regulator
MRPLYHPAVADVTVEGILYALADPVRVRIFAAIAASECPCICARFLKLDDRRLAKSTLSQHFKVLRESGLIRSERRGVEMHNTTRCAELKDRFGEMVAAILSAYGAIPAARAVKRARPRSNGTGSAPRPVKPARGRPALRA